MTNNFWNDKDFELFKIDGLENRMNALKTLVQPKFGMLGQHFSDKLSARGNDEFFPHVAQHIRRTVNPPTDSWVAIAPSKRGYKALPHFQIGLWETHLFIIIAIIYENPDKKGIAERLDNNLNVVMQLPEDYIVSGDHMKPEAVFLSETKNEGLEKVLERLKTVKKAELLIGRHLLSEDAIKMTHDEFIAFAEDTFDQLLPIYDIIVHKK